MYRNDKLTNVKWLYANLSKVEPFRSINHSQLEVNDIDCSNLKNFKSIGSYNWSTKSTPTEPIIIVPGKASILSTNLRLQKLTKSDYEQFCDENQFYMKSYPTEPLFRSVLHCSPDFEFKTVDFVTDRNNLRKLLDFVEKKSKESFRIDFQKCGNLIVFIRNSEVEKQNCQDYGKDFEHKYATDSLKEGAYRRVVSYTFGELKLVVRFEVDCIESRTNTVDDLVTSVTNMNLKANSQKERFEDSSLSFIERGVFDPTEIMIELATKSSGYDEYQFPESKWNQLFFSQTDNLIIGWHLKGKLQRIDRLSFQQVTEKCQRNEMSIANSTRMMHDLLLKLKTITKDSKDRTVFSIIYHKEKNENAIDIYECPNHKGSLPIAFLEKIS